MQSATGKPFLTIGTRGSPLALVQAKDVRKRLAEIHHVPQSEISIAIISTIGDRSQPANQPMSQVGTSGLFTKEIEDQLLAGTIDVGVHSSKDMASILPKGLVMPVFLPREDVRDAFVSLKYNSLDDLPEGATLGTSSLRRRAQIGRIRPDIKCIEFRGNVGTRLQKLENEIADATLLASAGLIRTGQADKITAFLDPQTFPPAPAQGAIGIEFRDSDKRVAELVSPLNDPETYRAIVAERAFLREMDGSCRTPIAALSTRKGDDLTLFGQVLSLDGSEVFEDQITGPADDGALFGPELARRLLEAAGPEFIENLKAL